MAWYYWQYHFEMPSIPKIVQAMQNNPRDVRYLDLVKVCEFYFGKARTNGSSHAVFRIPWAGDPRVNIQNDHGRAKGYQVRQVLQAISRLEQTDGE